VHPAELPHIPLNSAELPPSPQSSQPKWGRLSACGGLSGRLGVSLIAISLLLTSCASVGDPAYPSPQIPLVVNDLVAVQRGNRILVTFTIPPRTSDGVLLREIGAIDLRTGFGPAPFPSKEWIDAATPHPVQPPSDPGPVTTTIPIVGLVGKSVTVAERTMSGRRHYSAWSNPSTVEVQPPVSTPTDLTAKAGPNGIELAWQNHGASSFRIFRKAPGEKTPAPVGETDKSSFTDTTSEYDKPYQYSVQGLHDKAESEFSIPASITAVDTFPPAVPAGLTATPGINAIELSWERNTESDFRAYFIYRAAGAGPFEKLGETDSPVYSDHTVKSETAYRYAISAVDQKGNESAKSEPVETTAP
jgi:hypothetical protein